MTDAMFSLDDFEETRQDWVPLFKPFGITIASIIVGDRCRDCGTRARSTTQGSVWTIGIYVLCDDCAQIDGCRDSQQGPELHASHWGDLHPADEHTDLVVARERRRDSYRRRTAVAA